MNPLARTRIRDKRWNAFMNSNKPRFVIQIFTPKKIIQLLLYGFAEARTSLIIRGHFVSKLYMKIILYGRRIP